MGSLTFVAVLNEKPFLDTVCEPACNFDPYSG